MSLKIDRGLFKFDFIDHHAILCIPIDADVKDIRKRYLKIARHLHPDSSAVHNDVEKKLATELLSKLVNPAYETLSAERTRSEHIIIMSQIGRRLVQDSTVVEPHSDMGKQLLTAPNIEHAYKSAIAKMAETQYDILMQAIPLIAQISELNLVYLLRSAGKALSSPSATQSIFATSTQSPNTTNTTPPPPPREDVAIEQYLRRAQGLIDKNQFAPAKVELQDALKIAPKSSRCHSMLGFIYLKQNQLKMAKIHLDNALKLDPNDQTALTWKPKIDKVLGQQSSTQNGNSPSNSGSQQPDKTGGGLFGGLFGGKKK